MESKTLINCATCWEIYPIEKAGGKCPNCGEILYIKDAKRQIEESNPVHKCLDMAEDIYLKNIEGDLFHLANVYNIPEDVAGKLLELGRFINNYEPMD